MSAHPHHPSGISVLLLEFVIVSHSRGLPLSPLMLTCSRDEVKSDEVTDRDAPDLLRMGPAHLDLRPALPGTPVTKPVLSAVHMNTLHLQATRPTVGTSTVSIATAAEHAGVPVWPRGADTPGAVSSALPAHGADHALVMLPLVFTRRTEQLLDQ